MTPNSDPPQRQLSELEATALKIGGVTASIEQIADAIEVLKTDNSTNVKQPLLRHSNPLWEMDYHGIAKTYLQLHPEHKLPKGTPKKHTAHVKNALFHFLIEQLAELQLIAAAQDEVQEEPELLPTDDEDARKRILSEVIRRQGQQEFRGKLLTAYTERCAITGCDCADALEAAHICPYLGPKWNSVTNGLLLRADIHTLFDLHLLAIDPKTRKVDLSKRLMGTAYENLSGTQIADPTSKSHRPSEGALDRHWAQFRMKELAR